MKIATWNVNSLTARLQHVLDWLTANPVDVLCLQELKLSDDKFPLMELKAAGYEAAVFGQKTYNGVAILSRAPARDVMRNIGGFTDEVGYQAVDRPVHIHDLHATILHLLGLDHTRLTFNYGGRDFRLTDVYGDVVHDILA